MHLLVTKFGWHWVRSASTRSLGAQHFLSTQTSLLSMMRQTQMLGGGARLIIDDRLVCVEGKCGVPSRRVLELCTQSH